MLIFNVFGRTLIIYAFVLIVIRIMGKREVGQLEPFDLVIAIMIAEIAGIGIENIDMPLWRIILPIVTLLGAQISLAYISLKNEKARAWINGRPSIIIENGKIKESELRKLKYSLTDLLAQLRMKDTPNIADVEYAVLENSGDLTVVPKSQKRPITPKDLGIETEYEGLPTSLIIDGVLNYENIEKVNMNTDWLKEELKKFGIEKTEDCFLASIDGAGQLFLQKKEHR